MTKLGGSVGNLKNEGNKGNNLPYQLRSLLLLGEIADALGATPPGPVTPSIVEATVDGSTLGNKKSISLLFRGTGGTLGGVAVPDNSVFTFAPNGGNQTVSAIAYTVPTAGEKRIIITYVG